MPAAASSSRRQFFQKLYLGETSEHALEMDDLSLKDTAPTPGLAAHVAYRLMYGPKPGDVTAIQNMGVDNWLTDQLNPTGADTQALAEALAALPLGTLSEDTTTLWDRRYISYTEAIRPAYQVRHATVARRMHSKWQLFELMAEFWHEHFNIYAYDYPIMCLWPEWDRLLRQNALGNFRTMVEATAKHPAMLTYLDNYLSTNSGPNENYARELFELHTLGSLNYNTAGGYGDEDVYESSRCFTGWSYERSSSAADRGKFKYIRENHDRFQKTVMGVAIPRDQADLADGMKVIELVCNNEGTARHIALKLLRRFVSENPSEALLTSTANVFYQNRNASNQIALTLRHIFDSADFRSGENMANRFKKPFDFMISAMRALSIPYIYREGENSLDMSGMMSELGYTMFGWRSPDGPPDDYFSWATPNSMLRRYNFLFRIDSGWWTGRGLTYPAYEIMPAVRTTREVCQWWASRIIQKPISNTTFESLMTFVAEGRNFDLPLPTSQIQDKASRIALLCALTPEFMWR